MGKMCIECERLGKITPVWGKDYCKAHQYKREDYDRRSITQRSIDKVKEEKKRKPTKAGWFNVQAGFQDQHDAIVEPQKGTNEQWRWFQEQRSKMTGICAHCGGETQRYDDSNFHYSIAHVLPKAYFKSIATNDFNWIELCYYGNSCHSNYDRNMLDLTELNCFDEVIEKFVKMYPSIAKEERRRIPSILLEYLKTEI